MAFDTIYAEGQRRYVESLERVRRASSGADGQARRGTPSRGSRRPDLDRPEDDVAQPRSTVGSVTEIYDYCACCGRGRQSMLNAPADRRAVGGADNRPDHGPGGGHAVHGSAADRARGARARVRQAAAELRARAYAREITASCASSTRRSLLCKKYKHDISVVVDTPGHAAGTAQAAGGLGRDGGRPGGWDSSRSRPSRGWRKVSV